MLTSGAPQRMAPELESRIPMKAFAIEVLQWRTANGCQLLQNYKVELGLRLESGFKTRTLFTQQKKTTTADQ